LIVGSQGTLGIISEMIMKTEFVSARTAVAAMAFPTTETARDMLDQLESLQPAFVEYYDGDLFTIAAAAGKKYDFIKNASGKVGAVLLIGFDDFNEHARAKKLKRLNKLASNTDAYVEGADDETVDELLAIRYVTAYSVVPEGKTASAPPLIDGAYVPRERSEEFLAAAAAMAAKYAVVMPFHCRALDGTYYARPTLHLHKIGDKQKIFKIMDEYANLVEHFGGHLIGEGGEGRVKARFALKQFDPEVVELFAAVKAVFDPHGILNPGVKQPVEVRQLVPQLRSDYDTGAIASYVPYN